MRFRNGAMNLEKPQRSYRFHKILSPYTNVTSSMPEASPSSYFLESKKAT